MTLLFLDLGLDFHVVDCLVASFRLVLVLSELPIVLKLEVVHHLALLGQLALDFFILALKVGCTLLENRALISVEVKLLCMRRVFLLPVHLSTVELRLEVAIVLLRLL